MPYLPPESESQNINPGGGSIALPTWKPTHHLFQVDASAVEIEQPTATENDASGRGSPLTVVNGAFTVNMTQGTIFIPRSAVLTSANAIGLANTSDPTICVHLNYDNTNDTAPAKRPVVEGLAKASRAIAIRFEQQDSNRTGYRAVVEVFKTRLIPFGRGGPDLRTAPTSPRPRWRLC